MDIRQDVTLAPYTTFAIGGPADYFIEANSQDQLIEAITFAKEKKLPFFVLGTGANILVGDRGFRGVVIKNNANEFQISNIQYQISNEPSKSPKNLNNPTDTVLFTTDSGATMEELIKFTAQKGLSGLEHFAGIPSSVGGALWQNLHFLSPNRSKTVFIGDILKNASILRIHDEGSMIKEDADQAYFQFAYDYSILHDTHDVVVSATFTLTPEDPKVIQERIHANVQWRAEKHPANATIRSAGSVFKKIEGHGAGRLIEKVGLKGKMIGGAKISEKHANFIVNAHHATAKNVRDLIDLVQSTVKQQLNLDMQTEISFVGEF